MTDNVAILKGFTREVSAECDICSLSLLVKPETDLDGHFRAWNMDDQEFIRINGWLWMFEDA
jgi:hypothetical protein